jgi:hypothetical protein
LPPVLSPPKLRPQTQSQQQSQQMSTCGMCKTGGDSQSNELITCSLCGMSGHAHCLGASLQLFKRIKEFPDWECPNCKKCPICSTHDDDLIICSVCDRGFHRLCIKVSNSFSGNYFHRL